MLNKIYHIVDFLRIETMHRLLFKSEVFYSELTVEIKLVMHQ